MKISGIRRNHRLLSMIAVIFLLICFAGVSWGSSDGGQGKAATKRWVATDTYRVMNFVVLVVALFILLRKPVSNALKGRIKGIQDQLRDLEAKKKEAEKILVEYDEKLMQLDQEAEKVVAEYVKQGEAAKSRIIKEAESTAGKIEEQALRNIEYEFNMAKQKLQEEILDKALIQAEAKIRDKITLKDQEKLVVEYIEKVVV